jgi:hypothetical protein
MVDEVLLWMNSNWSTTAFSTDRSFMMDDRNSTVGMTSTDNGDHLQPLFSEYPDEVLHFAVGACVLFTLIGVPGNFITIVALLRYTKVSFPHHFHYFFKYFPRLARERKRGGKKRDTPKAHNSSRRRGLLETE